MTTIWKFPLELGENKIDMPKDPVFLTVQMQNGQICLWAIVDASAKKLPYRINVAGTGQDFGTTGVLYLKRGYLGTVQQPPYVWHVFQAV